MLHKNAFVDVFMQIEGLPVLQYAVQTLLEYLVLS
jgi:hypothetical protein